MHSKAALVLLRIRELQEKQAALLDAQEAVTAADKALTEAKAELRKSIQGQREIHIICKGYLVTANADDVTVRGGVICSDYELQERVAPKPARKSAIVNRQ
jgi:hypothetical protein